MVSFSCEVCNETLAKKKCQQHQGRCRGAYFTCLDCQKTFYGNDYVNHTSCISEADKYEKGFSAGRGWSKPKQQSTPAKKADSEKSKKTGSEKSKKSDFEDSIDLAKFAKKNHKISLYKVFKKLHKQRNIDEKHFLKSVQLQLNNDGSVTIN